MIEFVDLLAVTSHPVSQRWGAWLLDRALVTGLALVAAGVIGLAACALFRRRES